MWNIIGTLAGKFMDVFFDTPEVKAEKIKVKNQLVLAKLEAEKAAAMANINATTDYDNQAMKNKEKSWMDEIMAILHLLPVYGYVIPSEKVHQGLDRIWEQLGDAPYEWWLAYFGILCSTFGLRWLFGKQEVNKMLNQIELRKIENKKE